MRKKSIVFNIPFNNLNPLNAQTQALTAPWILRRIDIFMNYTLKSLKAQTKQEFRAYVRYDKRSENIIKSALAHYEQLPSNVSFICDEEYESRVYNYIRGSEYFYEIELGSDDMYHREFVQKMYDYIPDYKTVILICQDGYIYSSLTGELAEYFNYSSFFNCWIYNTTEYLNGFRRTYEGFVGAIRLQHEKIKWRAYINHSHHLNVAFSYEKEKTTPWGRVQAYIGANLEGQSKIECLKQFGISPRYH
ncbi:MAG: hypothetical protein ACRDDX_03185 [Cellulosilyticaceae bacterium]